MFVKCTSFSAQRPYELAGVEDPGIPAKGLTVAFLGPLVRYTVMVDSGPELIVHVHNPDEDFFR